MDNRAEQSIQMASKLYDARTSVKTLLGDDYWPRVDKYQKRIRNAMKASGSSEELEIAIHMADKLAKAGFGMDSMLALAAAVEMIEPSMRDASAPGQVDERSDG